MSGDVSAFVVTGRLDAPPAPSRVNKTAITRVLSIAPGGSSGGHRFDSGILICWLPFYRDG